MSDIPAREAQVYMQAARRLPVTIVRGEGTRVWDSDGKEYLDFVAWIAVVSLGHADAQLAEVIATALLGLWGQRQETRRADAAAQRSADLADRLQRSNAELEARVASRTDELQRALSQQETLVAELAELSVRDPLTGLHNRRHADDEIPRMVASADRHGQPLALAMADLDHFKVVNDEHSYSIGDEVLRTFARLLSENARASDLVVRYGGEEFLLVMPQTGLDQAVLVCERVRRSVAAHDWGRVVPELQVTVSVGVASTVQSAGLVTLVAAADAALHEAKRTGRDRVVSSPGTPRSVPTG